MIPGDCDKVLLVQAEFDGELDAAEAAALAVHRETCAVCQAAAAELAQTREILRTPGLYRPASDDLRARVLANLGTARPAAKPERPSVSTRLPPTRASTPVAIAYRIARNANSG